MSRFQKILNHKYLPLLISLHLFSSLARADSPAPKDPYLWLEEVQGKKALEWVKGQNTQTLERLKNHPSYKDNFAKALEVYTHKEKIPYVSIRGNYLYNTWQDDTHVQGLWRRTTLEEYKKAKPQWEVLLDLDKLSKEENKKWVLKGVDCVVQRCLLKLSDGGKDATVVREFDLVGKDFVKDSPFVLAEAKNRVSFVHKNLVLVASDFGEGSMTESGYPRQVKLWKRGSELENSSVLFEVPKAYVSGGSYVDRTYDERGFRKDYVFLYSYPSFFEAEYSVWDGEKNIPLPLAKVADLQGVYRGQVIFELKKAVKGLPAGSLVSYSMKSILRGEKLTQSLLFSPKSAAGPFFKGLSVSKEGVLLSLMNHVEGEIRWVTFKKGYWYQEKIDALKNGTISLSAADARNQVVMVRRADFLSPDTLYMGKLNERGRPTFEALKHKKAWFDADQFVREQHFATSKDGTKVPYFVVRKKDFAFNGKAPTLLYSYGGFQVSLTPSYSAIRGRLWLEKGGVYVLANIRGGGEYGPEWHQSALKLNRHKAYEDFYAVAEDLISKKITGPKHLGIQGGSNGGLLMGVAYTQRPELFSAVVCQVPLLDMLRFHKLLAGASWVGEYGSPEIPLEREYLASYSPYQNVGKEQSYPPIFFMTSTKDDRVHPGHARKMAAKIAAMGAPLEYYENPEGGHAAAATPKDHAFRNALSMTFLWRELAGGLRP